MALVSAPKSPTTPPAPARRRSARAHTAGAASTTPPAAAPESPAPGLTDEDERVRADRGHAGAGLLPARSVSESWRNFTRIGWGGERSGEDGERGERTSAQGRSQDPAAHCREGRPRRHRSQSGVQVVMSPLSGDGQGEVGLEKFLPCPYLFSLPWVDSGGPGSATDPARCLMPTRPTRFAGRLDRAEAMPFSIDSPGEAFDAAVDRVVGSLGIRWSCSGLARHARGEEMLLLRNRLFRRLVEAHGYTAIAIESSFPRGRLVNEYISGEAGRGAGGAAAAALSSGGAGGRVWARVRAAEEANRELVEWMRGYNAGVAGDPSRRMKLRFYGFDMPGVAAGPASPVRSCAFIGLPRVTGSHRGRGTSRADRPAARAGRRLGKPNGLAGSRRSRRSSCPPRRRCGWRRKS